LPWRFRRFERSGWRTMPRPSSRSLLLGAAALLVAAAAGAWFWRPGHASGAADIAGIVRTTEIHIAPEVSGRLARFLVQPG
jgi:multidrug resistance efflux pump